jgi:2-polyprenyl-6-methoxyphenol hydroxylase-like FAD-dependent oxidoreductase
MGDSGSAAVIGGGIGGLAAAIALRARGWDVTVFERAPALTEVGAGIAVAANALTALDAMGVGPAVRSLSALQGAAGIRRRDGRWLSRTSAEEAEARYGNPTLALHRAALLKVLADAVPASALRLGAEAALVDPAAGLVSVGGGAPTAYDLVVAADGLRSAARRVIFPASPDPVYAGVTSWRIVVDAPSSPVVAAESWGRGTVFGMAVLADGRIYCYATAVAPEGGRAADEKAELARLFAGWHDPIPTLIDAADTVLRTDIRCLPSIPPRFHSGRVALLGDAAHAMTPNLGQGGCQAIEDAVVLAHEVGRAPVDAALPAYSAARRDRTASVAARSRRITGLTRVANPAGVALRDGGMWLAGRLGPNLVMRQMDDVMSWRAPTAP